MYLGDRNAPGPFERLQRATAAMPSQSPPENGIAAVQPPPREATVTHVAAASGTPRQVGRQSTDLTATSKARQSELLQLTDNGSPHGGGAVLQNMAGATFLRHICAADFTRRISPADFQAFRDSLLKEAGDPKDPLARMAIEQLAWCHFRIGQLQGQSSTAQNPDTAVKLNAAAAKLMSEFRKLLLAVREYRAPSRPQQLTVVRQQNVAAGDQQVALVEAPVATP